MSRTSKYKLLYVLALIALSGLAVWAILASGKSPVVIAGVVLVLIVPGRICGVYWREFFKGRNLMTHGRFLEAEPYFERFLAKLRDRPWLKRLIIFSWGMYTRDIEVMTLNNLGVISIEQGKFEDARELLDRAVSLDPQAPLPYFNLALIAAADNREDLAKELLGKAEERGFTGSSVDQLIRQAGELLARIEGRLDKEHVTGGDA